ncbi:C-C motif chemokine 15-like [Phyllostomus hastatus]|uniref:C-C motif chemokine 15-like n=1 Tax=Phyllostomus hastatus TaxID=9423 RepID=UPI001E681EB2|nr:C-C motif chemokine 15-like [Phyllostomus hastatus]
MKVSTAALPFLILAAALGPPARASLQAQSPAPDYGRDKPVMHHSFILQPGVHHHTDCCYKTTQNIRCRIMEDYYQTSSVCHLPAVIFKTKRGKVVCANPDSVRVQRCMQELDSANPRETGRAGVPGSQEQRAREHSGHALPAHLEDEDLRSCPPSSSSLLLPLDPQPRHL